MYSIKMLINLKLEKKNVSYSTMKTLRKWAKIIHITRNPNDH